MLNLLLCMERNLSVVLVVGKVGMLSYTDMNDDKDRRHSLLRLRRAWRV